MGKRTPMSPYVCIRKAGVIDNKRIFWKTFLICIERLPSSWSIILGITAGIGGEIGCLTGFNSKIRKRKINKVPLMILADCLIPCQPQQIS